MKSLLKQIITGKKVAILGFGREGKSTLKLVGEVSGAKSVTILDLNNVTLDKDMEEVKLLIEKSGSEFGTVSGEHYQDNLDDYDIVVKSPGIVLDKDISEYNTVITSQTEIFFTRYKGQIIGITGTKGKSTTTTLIHHIFEHANKNTILAGNIGIPAFDIIDGIDDDTIIVFEMSSHMLEYMTVAPHVGVFLNIHEEHLDHYGTMDKYVAAKMNIVNNQEEGDVCFVNESIETNGVSHRVDICETSDICDTCKVCESYDSKSKSIESSDKVCINMHHITFNIKNEAHEYDIPVDEIALIGSHNYYDIAVAYGVVKMFDIADEEFEAGLKTYRTLPHRLEPFGTYAGIKFYDDSISTICDTTIKALSCIDNAGTVLIGGMDRGIDYTELIEYLSLSSVKNIIFMYSTGERIYNEILHKYEWFVNKERMVLVDDLTAAVEKAYEVTTPGMACILSPAAASYGYFKNFEERGDMFKMLVKSHENK